MSAGGVLLGLLNVALTCAIIIFVAWCIVWAFSWFGVTIHPMVMKFGQIIVALMCLIVIVGWLLSLLGGGVGYTPRFFLGRW